LEAGKVLLKKNAPWLEELRAEMLPFPNGKHDDQVDALSQLMTVGRRSAHSETQRPAFAVGNQSTDVAKKRDSPAC
jgi:phage terminase large subunit-like protein